jgi:uncharacterized membrane protein YcaP (DUF421 family)
MWHNLVSIGSSWQERAIRAVVVYVFLLIAIRIFGRRELGQLTAFDIIVLLTLSNILQNAMIGNDNSVTGGFVGAAFLLSANLVLAFVVSRRPRIEKVIEGEPKVLVLDGRVQMEALRRQMLTEQDLLAAIHREGIEHLEDVHLVISEPNGMISVIARR